MRDLWIRLYVHALLRGSYVFNGVEMFPDTKPPATAKSPTNAEPSTTESFTSAQSSTIVETATIVEVLTNAKSPNNAKPSTNMESSTNAGPSSTKLPGFEPSGFVDVWRGNYRGNPVCIKAIRARNKSNLHKIKKVRDSLFRSGSHSPPIIPDLLPQWSRVQAFFPSEYTSRC